MEELINKYLNNGLADFEGLEIAGSVPIKQEVINEFITSFLQKAASEGSEPAPSGAKASGGGNAGKSRPSLPIKSLVGMVKRAEVQAVEGKVVLHFAIKR